MQLFTYEGPISFVETTALIQRIVSRAAEWDNTRKQSVMITLKKCGSSAEPKEIQKLFNSLEEACQHIGHKIALIDYSKPLYDKLRHHLHSQCVLLLESKEIATLLLEPEKSAKPMNVLLFEPDPILAKEYIKQLRANGHKVSHVTTTQEFQDRRMDSDINMTITKSHLPVKKSATPAGKLQVSKQLIANLPLFINTSVETLMTLTQLNASKSAHGVGTMHSPISPKPYCSVMEFKGDLKGSFYLIFPKPIAIKALAALIGSEDENEEYSQEEILDGVGEFCNIITGSIKRDLQEREINVIFELPKTYTSVEESSQDYNTRQGIWIDMELEGSPFNLFIS